MTIRPLGAYAEINPVLPGLTLRDPLTLGVILQAPWQRPSPAPAPTGGSSVPIFHPVVQPPNAPIATPILSPITQTVLEEDGTSPPVSSTTAAAAANSATNTASTAQQQAAVSSILATAAANSAAPDVSVGDTVVAQTPVVPVAPTSDWFSSAESWLGESTLWNPYSNGEVVAVGAAALFALGMLMTRKKKGRR